MGVRGLTTYIERNKDKYLRNYQLRDTQLVIDGNSLCAQLYKYYAKCNDEFGGDYDKFARCIETFFAMLKQCNVSPIVILDGGYEWKKIRTVKYRLQNKLQLIQNMNPAIRDSTTIFPLFHREVFKGVVQKLGIPLVRCDFEADLDIACVARKIKCPVLSLDSDFFIYDALYIPFNTMDFYTTKINDKNGSSHYISCKIYNIELFLKKSNIDKSLLPLMATLLGNDYIKKAVFSKFYKHIKLPKKKGSKSEQHRTIIALMKWLEHENFKSAVRKILSRLKKHERAEMAQQIKKVTQGYICSYSELFESLGLTKSDTEEEDVMDIDPDDIESENDDSDDNNSDDTNTSDSEDNDELDLSIEPKNKSFTINSDWFKNNIRNGNFPTLFMDILSLNMGIYQPQLEDVNNIESYNIFLPLLQHISKILLENKSRTFFYLGRNKNSRAQKYTYNVSNLYLPKFSEIENLNRKLCVINFMKTVKFQKEDWNKILQFPEKLQLYFLSLVYWVRNATFPTPSYCHISSIILCLLHLSIVDEKVPNKREKNNFLKTHDKKLKDILEKRKLSKDTDATSAENLMKSFENIDDEDCLFFIEELVPNFKINDKVKTNKKLFSIHIVDAFAQFQSCLLYISYLNALFKFPLPSFEIWNLYNGTYIYNLYSNLEKRNNVVAYIELILKNSPTLLSVFKQIMNVLSSLVELDPIVKTNKKRKRKKKKTVSEADMETNENQKSESENETIFDHNNKFSILALTD